MIIVVGVHLGEERRRQREARSTQFFQTRKEKHQVVSAVRSLNRRTAPLGRRWEEMGPSWVREGGPQGENPEKLTAVCLYKALGR